MKSFKIKIIWNICFRYLASGCTFTDLHYSYRLGISTISKIVRSVCQAIWSLRQECISVPTSQHWEEIAKNFEQIANFPHCIGAVDGKHIRIVHPCNSMYYNYKGYSSIVMMAVADSRYRFIYVDVGSYGKDSDSTIFQESSLWKSLLKNELALPKEKCLPGTISPKVPYFFVADEAFGLHRHLLRPFGGHQLTIAKRVFNYRLSRARRFVECSFGILSNKWRIFHKAINLKPDFATDIVKSCVVLHNFVLERDGYQTEDALTIVGLQSMSRSECVRGGIPANNVRKIMMDYFLTPIGSVKWQLSKI